MMPEGAAASVRARARRSHPHNVAAAGEQCEREFGGAARRTRWGVCDVTGASVWPMGLREISSSVGSRSS